MKSKQTDSNRDDDRTRQQKAADTRRANKEAKEAEERRALEECECLRRYQH